MEKLNDLDVEHMVSNEGYEYKTLNGKSGMQVNVKTCPACQNDNYKVYLNADTGLGNCFVCDYKFNKYKFIKEARNLASFKDVMGYIENNYSTSSVSYRPKIKKVYTKYNLDFNLPLNIEIKEEEQIPKYLADRDITLKICKRFNLRFCEHGFYKAETAAGGYKFVDFSQRIIIPIYDIEGNLVTFQGRDITNTAEKKYLFPVGLPGTGRYIYNANHALKNKSKIVILNEGVFDVYATTDALESDIKYNDYVACGSFGKNLSIALRGTGLDDQLTDLIKLAENGVQEFVLLWDGEKKAIKSAYKAVALLNDIGLFATIAILKDDLDPAETKRADLLAAIDSRFKPSKFDLLRINLSERI